MKGSLKQYLKYGNTYCGIEHGEKDGQELINGCLIKRSGDEIDVVETFTDITRNRLFSSLPKGQHVSLVINTDQVLTRLVDRKLDDSDEQVILGNFPNIKLTEFYYQVVKLKDKHVVSLCRKEHVDALIAEYYEHKLFVVDFSLGLGCLEIILPFLEGQQVNLGNLGLEIEKDVIRERLLSEEKTSYHRINGLQVSSTNLLSFSAALGSVFNNRKGREEKKYLRATYLQHRIFEKGLRIGLMTVFGILLINFLVFNHQYNKVRELEELAQSNQASKALLVNLQKEVDQNRDRYENLLRIGNSRSSFYLNDLVSSLPQQIILTKYAYQPLKTKIKEEKHIDYNADLVFLSGKTSNKNSLSEFIERIENKLWVKEIEVNHYRDLAGGQSEFNLRVQMKNED